MTPLQEKQIDKLADKMELEYEFEIVQVRLESFSRERQCYYNVAEKINRDGGKFHYGWSVHFNEGLIIEAERHAVWENDDEELICVTQNPNGSDEVIFLSDNRPVDKDEQIDNVRMNITDNPLIDDWIYVCEAIGFIYANYSERIDDEQVNVQPEIYKSILELENGKGYIMGLMKSGRKGKSNCFCEEGLNGKKYLHCHSKYFRREIPALLDNIKENYKPE